ncbi:glutaredoxin family protein [Rothia kristinae]|uniref:glutaredoxin family protein n=1 Tax=Rothia kristinae TaxID=37923 RepID=UPI0022E5FDF5|nr:glutaredoxin family protein [Rothia kristinae]MDN5640157.1 glutaredoxin family protein [Actinomycetes bacterium]
MSATVSPSAAAGSPAGSAPRLELLTSAGCHLCEQARRDLDAVTGEFGLDWSARDIDGDPQLLRRYGTEIPVLLIDGTPRDFWRIDVPRLRRLLAGLLAGRDPEA